MVRKKRQLRGAKLLMVIKAELGRMVHLSPKTDPISVSAIAKRLKVSRQTIYSNGLKPTVDEHTELQKTNHNSELEIMAKRRPLEDRVKALEQENTILKEKLDNYLERWVAVEYNARMLGIDADELFVPPPKPFRMVRRG